MKTKLTLSIDAEVIEKAKRTSEKRKQSLSFIVEDFLRTIAANTSQKNKKKAPTFTEMFRNKFPAAKNFTETDYKKQWHNHLDEEYGK